MLLALLRPVSPTLNQTPDRLIVGTADREPRLW